MGQAYSSFAPLLAGLSAFLICGTIRAADAPPAALPPSAMHTVNFAREIKPLFEASCVQCHAKGKDKGGLSLETRKNLLKGGDTGAAVTVGDSAESLIVKAVAGVDADTVMPKKGTKWTSEQVGLLRAWIDQGMTWDPAITFAKPEPLNLKPRRVQLPDATASHPLDVLISQYMSAHKIAEPAPVDDATFCRRAYLDVIGLLPTPEQLDGFCADADADKRAAMVKTLLADNRDYADHWLTFWNDLLRNDYRGTGFIDGGRRQISGWLYAALIENKPYDRFVADLVNPSKPSEGFSRGIIWRGSVNASMQPPVQAAQNVAQVFMGVNLKCASCHDSFINNWTLSDCYGLAACYSDQPLELILCDKPTGKLSAPRFLYPQVGTLEPGAQRLRRLAELMTSPANGRLPRTIVNRLWARLMGRGLVEPIDDMEKPAWSADILDWLADDLVAHHYNLKHTIEVILTSRAYQLPSMDVATSPGEYEFHGPIVRRLTAEQFCDAITSLTGQWARFPATLDIDFTAGDLVGPVNMPAWIWTDEPVDVGTERLREQAKKKSEKKAEPEKKAESSNRPDDDKPTSDADKSPAVSKDAMPPETAKDQPSDKDGDKDKDKFKDPADALDPLARHKVVFRKTFGLDKAPAQAFAAASASQSMAVRVNGKPARAILSDGQRNGRTALYDLKPLLTAGENVIVLEVSSHTEKKLNDAEKAQFPESRNHVNTISGAGFYLRATFGDGHFTELTTDESWHVRRAPEGKWSDKKYDTSGWSSAIRLPKNVAPIDEGPSLRPVARMDFANEPIELATPMRTATSTAVQPGGIRASLLAADSLMTALDRPNREQVMTSRSTAATTLQALEVTNGSNLDTRLKQAAQKLTAVAAKDPAAWITQSYKHLLGRSPTGDELDVSLQTLGTPVTPNGVADLLWGLTMLPEFQYIH
jgi:hypothetical protein